MDATDRQTRKERWTRTAMRAGGLALGSGMVAFASLIVYITVTGNHTELRHTDCIIVPGARILPDGRPGPVLSARIANAIRLYREGWAGAIIFTGGQGESGPIESEQARAVALAQDLPARDLYVETKSHTTVANFAEAREIMRAHGWRSCLVSTDPFHATRCIRIARDLGIEAYPAPAFDSPGYTRASTRTWYTLRECAAWGRYVLHRLMPGAPGGEGATRLPED